MRWNPKGEDDTRQPIEEYLEETGHQTEVDSYNHSTYDWKPNNHDDKILRITKSSVGTFDWCPKQYWFSKVIGIRSDEVYYHTRGKNVHDIVEYFWDNVDEVLPDVLKCIEDGRMEQARGLLYDVIPKPPNTYEFGEEGQIKKWFDWNFNRLIYTKGVNWKPVGIEANIHATRVVEVDGTPVPIHMRGYIDTIFNTGEGGYAVMELKTGKWKKGKKKDMRKEMQFYRMMLEYSPHHEFLPITHWGWEFPGGDIEGGEGAHTYYENVKDARTAPNEVEKSLVAMIKAYINDDFPMTGAKQWWNSKLGRYQNKCEWCDYIDVCPQFTQEEYIVGDKK